MAKKQEEDNRDVFEKALDDGRPYVGAAIGAGIGGVIGRRLGRSLSKKQMEALKGEAAKAKRGMLLGRGADAERAELRLIDIEKRLAKESGRRGGATGFGATVGGATGAYSGWQQRAETKRLLKDRNRK